MTAWAETAYYQYDALGREIARRLPNTVTTYHNYDVASQVTSLIHRGSSNVLQSLYYTYDNDGQRTKITREDNTRVYYSYDAAHRLTGEDWLDPSNTHLYAFAYQYDAAGNRTRQTCNTATTYYQYNNLNELTTERVLGGGATYYTWTADGEMATKHETAGWTYYTWDVDESLRAIQTPTVTLESKYNSRMQRVWRSENGTTEKLVYDAQKLIAEATSTGTALNRYYLSAGGSIYSPLLAQLGSEHWFLADALGTTLGRTGTTVTPYQYVGGYGYFREAAVGLEQVWWRWLDGPLGRWIATEMGADWSNSSYAGSAPSIFVDADGRSPVVPRFISIGGAMAEAYLCYKIAIEVNDFLRDLPLIAIPDFDKWQHCMATCLIASIVGPSCAETAIIVHDGTRPPDERRTHLPPDIAGLKASFSGLLHYPQNIWQHCDTACIHAGYYRLFQPGCSKPQVKRR